MWRTSRLSTYVLCRLYTAAAAAAGLWQAGRRRWQCCSGQAQGCVDRTHIVYVDVVSSESVIFALIYMNLGINKC